MLAPVLARPLGWALLSALLTAPLILGCVQQVNRGSRGVMPAANTSGWVVNAPPATGFRVSMPGTAQVETSQETEIDGAKASVVEGHVMSGSMFFEYSVRTVEGGVAGEVEDLREPSQRLSNSRSLNDIRVREERNYRDDTGYRVLERVFDGQNDGGLAFTAFIRVYVGRARIIRALVVVPTVKESAFTAQTSYFFDSVRLDPADAASPAGDGRFDAERWSWAYPPEGSFAAYYPGLPGYESSTFMHEDEERTIHRYFVSGAGRSPIFAVRAIAYGERPPDDAFSSARGSWTSSGWEIVDERPAQRTGYGGLELVLRKEGRRARVRYYVTNAGIYEVYVDRADSLSDSLDRAERRFFASFRML
ncbi:MAG: hypothetical protein AAF447_03065 [Myxococcota bacterium]